LKDILTNLKQNPNYNIILNWSKLISVTGSFQILVQAIGFISGILIIRLLTIQEYAFYTLANTMLGAMSILSDGGISSGVMSQGGKVWQDKKKLGKVLVTGLQMRKKFGIISLIVCLPILFYLLIHNGADFLTALLIILALIPAFFAALSDTLLEIPLKLNQSILPLQKNQIIASIGRLLLIASTIFLFPFAYLSILAGGISRIYGNFKLKKITNSFADSSQLEDESIKNEISVIVKRSLPGNIYYCLSGQISTWIISIFGNVAFIAQIGALGRISSVFNILLVLFATLVVPRFARIQDQPKKILHHYSKIIISFIVISIFIVGFTYLFSNQILWVLGKNYQGLNSELTLLIMTTTITMIMSSAVSLCLSRGWVLPYYITIVASLLPIILGCYIFDISTLKGILYLNIFVALMQMVLNVSYGYIKILKWNKVQE
jgi:O-antigen/teichoic acid export membrane protein